MKAGKQLGKYYIVLTRQEVNAGMNFIIPVMDIGYKLEAVSPDGSVLFILPEEKGRYDSGHDKDDDNNRVP
jgi:hypothetical protein